LTFLFVNLDITQHPRENGRPLLYLIGVQYCLHTQIAEIFVYVSNDKTQLYIVLYVRTELPAHSSTAIMLAIPGTSTTIPTVIRLVSN
jgi:hypothetical protein